MTQSISRRETCGALTRPAISLERWGVPAEGVAALATRLAHALPGIDWHKDGAAPSGALSLHLVDFSALAGSGRAVWNTAGPVEALRQARSQGQPSLALCRGRVGQMPAVRRGVWVMAADKPWDAAVQSLVRALSVLEWTREDGYKAVHAWGETRKFAQRNLLAVTSTDDTASNFSTVLRDALSASLAIPAVLAVAGAPESELRRTIVEAGLHDLQAVAATPMTLDGVMRVDALLGFDWPALD
ncbi:hypothetical protein [Achromobacter sp. MFA1 R4]|uniref:hypothetical protein n=1 Tax=Achromobacter sp. MFA1 R4 TaxID=1881016 RepID=UPI0009538A6A|nr:hypothetical protein [Achromobacter sp. MFA1 R4]SIT17796.1 hypothetical protein SAMN05428937_1594 [Achromobacter sp. MFA1 R4]